MKPAVPETLPILKASDWASLVPHLGRANRCLAQYSGMLRRLPNSSILLSPLTVQEAVLSSRIEGTFATMSEVLQFEAGEIPPQESQRQDIEEILNYRQALDEAVVELQSRPFSLNLLLRLHKILLTSVRGQNKAPGFFRKSQNYIGSRVGGVETVRFTPPEWTKLAHALDNWEKYYHSEEQDPLAQLALIHAQFEFLHPFLDGNGRIGRILIPIFLFEKKLLPLPTFYLSEFLEEHRESYVDNLNALGRRGPSWRHWVKFFLEAIETQSARNMRKSDAILTLYEGLKNDFIGITRSKFAVPLLDAVFEKPYFQASQLTWKGQSPSKPTLNTMLQNLEAAHKITLIRPPAGTRPAIWAIPDLISLAETKFQIISTTQNL